jgi:hypothetical protein
MLDVKFPTSDCRTLLFERYTTPDKPQKLLLAQLGLELPEQRPPRITNQQTLEPLNRTPARRSEDRSSGTKQPRASGTQKPSQLRKSG